MNRKDAGTNNYEGINYGSNIPCFKATPSQPNKDILIR